VRNMLSIEISKGKGIEGLVSCSRIDEVMQIEHCGSGFRHSESLMRDYETHIKMKIWPRHELQTNSVEGLDYVFELGTNEIILRNVPKLFVLKTEFTVLYPQFVCWLPNMVYVEFLEYPPRSSELFPWITIWR